MPRRGTWNIENRAIKNFKVSGVALPSGRYAIIVTTLGGGVVEHIEAHDKAEAEHHFRDMGYERVPSFVAFEIDQGDD